MTLARRVGGVYRRPRFVDLPSHKLRMLISVKMMRAAVTQTV